MAKKRARRNNRKSKRISKAFLENKQIPRRKVTNAFKGFLLFAILAFVCFALCSFNLNDSLISLFSLLTLIFGFVSFAFLIAFIVVLVVRSIKR